MYWDKAWINSENFNALNSWPKAYLRIDKVCYLNLIQTWSYQSLVNIMAVSPPPHPHTPGKPVFFPNFQRIDTIFSVTFIITGKSFAQDLFYPSGADLSRILTIYISKNFKMNSFPASLFLICWIPSLILKNREGSEFLSVVM